MTPSTTTNRSVLAQLRDLVPPRSLTFSEALRIAELQANHLLELNHISQPPIPSDLIAVLPRIQVEVHPRMPVGGSAHWANGRWVLRLACSDHPRRRRFSLCHEFHHILLHPYRGFLYDSLDPDHRQEQVERIADTFAACLLMPKRLVRQVFTAGVQDPYKLARIFDVSPSAMRVRLDQLGLARTDLRCDTTWRQSRPTTMHARHEGARR